MKLLLTTSLVLTTFLSLTPVSAQRRPGARKPNPQAPAATFDTLLASDSYKIYCEVRGVGQLIQSDAANDTLDPIMKLADPPREFKHVVNWLTSRADSLLTSRLMLAALPNRSRLPQFLVAIEFGSPEEARRFAPQLKEFLPIVLPAPASESLPSPGRHESQSEQARSKEPQPQKLPYLLKQTGNLVLITDSPFSFKDLRPLGSRLLADDRNFRIAHDRLSYEPIFFFVDFAAIQKEEQEQLQKFEEERKRAEAEAAKQPQVVGQDDQSGVVAPAPPYVSPQEIASTPTPGEEVDTATGIQTADSGPAILPSMFSNVFFGGEPRWPEALGASVAFDADSYVVRVLLVSAPGVKGSVIPFMPQFVSGPALAPEAPSIMPADTELLVSTSLDFPQVYEAMDRAMRLQVEQMQKYNPQPVKVASVESPFEAYEKQLGLKIKDDLLPLLGNEIAMSLPMKTFDLGPPEPAPSPVQATDSDDTGKPKQPDGPSPVFAISIKDREAARILIPRIIESLGVKGASMLAQTERREDTELVSYVDAVAYAFVGNFLVFSPDVKATRHVVDSYLNHETLSSSPNFRNYTRWQPPNVLGQVYVSQALMELYSSYARDTSAQISDQLRDFFLRISPTAEPVTYSLTDEGLGPLHELHVPKNLVMLLVAGISGSASQSPMLMNEAMTQNALTNIARVEETFRNNNSAGRYATLDELINEGMLARELLENYGYRIELAVFGTHFEVTAVPLEYGKSGNTSYYLDETSVLRAGDHAGGAATIADKPVR